MPGRVLLSMILASHMTMTKHIQECIDWTSTKVHNISTDLNMLRATICIAENTVSASPPEFPFNIVHQN